MDDVTLLAIRHSDWGRDHGGESSGPRRLTTPKETPTGQAGAPKVLVMIDFCAMYRSICRF